MAYVELSTAIAREHILAGLLTKANVENNYDYVLLDCPPSLGLVTLNAITASTDVLIPLILKSATLLKSQSVAAQTAKNAIFLVRTDFLPCVG